MTETTATATRTSGLSERGALAYLYWPLAAAVILTVGNLEHVVATAAAWLGL